MTQSHEQRPVPDVHTAAREFLESCRGWASDGQEVVTLSVGYHEFLHLVGATRVMPRSAS